LPYTGGLASEPGLDYLRLDVQGFDNPAEVCITDYCAEKCATSNRLYSLRKLEDFFKAERPKWAKVRWINVVGLNWRFIKFLAIKYNLHRLAIEDLLSVQRTKIDTYQDRTIPHSYLAENIDIYVCLLMHALIGEDDRIVTEDDASSINEMPSSPSGSLFKKGIFRRHHDSDEQVHDSEHQVGLHRRSSLPIAQHYNPDRTLIYDHVNSSREGSLTVAMEQVSIFLTIDGTVLSFFQVPNGVAALMAGQRDISRATHCRATCIANNDSQNYRRSVAVAAKPH